MAETYLTPSALNKYLKAVLENDQHLKTVKIRGEISNLKYHSNGNMYFDIKDNDAQISCLKFGYKTLTEKFNEGDSVEVDGSLYLYVKSGRYNINVNKIKNLGVGDLLLKYNEMKLKLSNEGLFASEHKKAIPNFPQKIGVITAATGAAIKDILITLKDRYPLAKVTVYSTLVQGKYASEDICNKINYADNDNNDVIIVGRGGGSIEDLWSFNEENVAYAIYNCLTPIISSVGHETDTTIADLVADVRAATPTAAAQIATPDYHVIINNVDKYKTSLVNILQMKLENEKLKVNTLTSNQYFVNPLTKINLHYDEIATSFNNKIVQHRNVLQIKHNEISNFETVLISNIQTKLKLMSNNIENIHNMLDGLNPLAILSRGYSTIKNNDKIIKSINEVNIGENITVNLSDGEICAEVLSKEQS